MTYRIVCVGHNKFKIQKQYSHTYEYTTGFWRRTKHELTTYDWYDMIICQRLYGYVLSPYREEGDDMTLLVTKDVAKSIIDKYVKMDEEIENERRLDREAILANPPEIYP